MKVSDIISLMGTLSLGADNVTEDEKSIFLTYLNLAHAELYSKTANFNQALLKSESFAPDLDEGDSPSSYTLSEIPFFVNSVYLPNTRQRLTEIAITDILLTDPAFSNNQNPGQPTNYFISNNVVSLYPLQTAATPALIWYCPNSTDFTLTTPESDIPYPRNFHRILADGALYYVYQDVPGFRNSEKETASQKRWERGKSELVSYLYNSSGISFGTFQSA
jgi:hypothetical protein